MSAEQNIWILKNAHQEGIGKWLNQGLKIGWA
jgi:hypothetical protein